MKLYLWWALGNLVAWMLSLFLAFISLLFIFTIPLIGTIAGCTLGYVQAKVVALYLRRQSSPVNNNHLFQEWVICSGFAGTLWWVVLFGSRVLVGAFTVTDYGTLTNIEELPLWLFGFALLSMSQGFSLRSTGIHKPITWTVVNVVGALPSLLVAVLTFDFLTPWLSGYAMAPAVGAGGLLHGLMTGTLAVKYWGGHSLNG